MSVNLSPEVIGIIKKSLTHYFDLLPKLSFQEELLELTKIDLKNECILLLEVQHQVDIKTTDPPPYLHMPNNPKYNKVICSALKCYREDLKKSMKTITSLYVHADISLSLTEEELKLVDEAIQKMTECG